MGEIKPDIEMAREPEGIGRALSADELQRLLTVCRKSASRSLYPAVLISVHTGLRKSELRLMKWRQVDFTNQAITVEKSKTAGGQGRLVPLSIPALQSLYDWRAQFPNAIPSHYVFPSEKYGLMGKAGKSGGEVRPYEVNPESALKTWKTAWSTAKKAAGVECRWHNLRHCFVSALGQGEATDTTITALAGWMSPKMLTRYSHVAMKPKREAVSSSTRGHLQLASLPSPQNHPQAKKKKP